MPWAQLSDSTVEAAHVCVDVLGTVHYTCTAKRQRDSPASNTSLCQNAEVKLPQRVHALVMAQAAQCALESYASIMLLLRTSTTALDQL